MATKRRLKSSSDRENWNRIFENLVKMLQSQQTQLEALAKERKLLEDRIRMQHDRWLSDVRLFEHQISQVKGDFLVQDRVASLEAAKSELFVGLEHREAYFSKLRLAYAESELEDFKALFKLVSKKSHDTKGGGKDSNKNSSTSTKDAKQHPENLKSELRRLKQDYDKLVLQKNTEVASLLAEKKFVWNQYKVLENDCASKLKSQNLKVEQAEERVQALIASMEHLKSSNDKKEARIVKLSSDLTKTREESDKFKEETYKLSNELDLLRNSRTGLVTPVLNRCTTRTTQSSKSRDKQRDKENGIISLKKESSSVQVPESKDNARKGTKVSKRLVEDVLSASDSPKLLSSSFKVPKLKNSASVVRL